MLIKTTGIIGRWELQTWDLRRQRPASNSILKPKWRGPLLAFHQGAQIEVMLVSPQLCHSPVWQVMDKGKREEEKESALLGSLWQMDTHTHTHAQSGIQSSESSSCSHHPIPDSHSSHNSIIWKVCSMANSLCMSLSLTLVAEWVRKHQWRMYILVLKRKLN